MTLAEMADYVCVKVRETDDASVATCKTFIRQRFDMVYNSQLWRESVGMISITVDPTLSTLAGQNAANGIVHLPNIVDRVLAIRSPSREMPPELQETFFRMDYDAFEQTGEPCTWHQLSKAVLTFPEDRGIYVGGFSEADMGSPYYLKWTDGDGNSYDSSANKVVQTLSSLTLLTDIATKVPAYGLDSDTAASVRTLESFTKTVTDGSIYIYHLANGSTTEGGYISLTASQTSCQPAVRIQLVYKPTVSVVLRVLCKRKIVPVTNDNDTLCLTNVDNCILAFAQADMLQRARQYGKAQASTAEGMALLESLKTSAVVQDGTNRRVIPVCENEGPTVFETQKGYW